MMVLSREERKEVSKFPLTCPLLIPTALFYDATAIVSVLWSPMLWAVEIYPTVASRNPWYAMQLPLLLTFLKAASGRSPSNLHRFFVTI